MSTSNFAYTNRCIAVTDEDYEIGNLPKYDKKPIGNSRSYPSYEITEDDMDAFDFWKVILTTGYYEGACIDYIPTDTDAKYWLGECHYYTNKREVIEECIKQFGLTRYRLNKILPKLTKDISFEEWYENAIDQLTDYLSSVEESQINEYLDKLKNRYGFEEYVLLGCMSNGSAIYKPI